MANIKDFAAGIVVTPPSPATSGTSITLRAGDGATMPTAPFYVTATPPGQLTTLGTSEKLLVTAVSGDTLTVTRAQTPTSAKSIDTNWVVANAMYVDDVMKSNIATDESLSGTKNGTNKVFTTASAFTAIQVYKNGVAMHIGDDFTVTGGNQITMVTAPATGTKLTATYIIGSQIMIAGSNSTKSDETPTGTVNGSNTSFTTLTPYIANTLQVYINGVKQKRGTHFSEVTPTSGTFTISDAPLTGDDVMVEYQFVQSVAGNADTVDGYHANATPTANNIPVLDSNGTMPAASLGGSWTAWTPTITANSGTFTTVTSSGRYTQIGKTVHFSLRITQTNIGSAAGFTSFTLPITALFNPANDTVGYGREDALTGNLLQCRAVSSTSAAIIKYDNTAIVTNGAIFNIKGTYEAA